MPCVSVASEPVVRVAAGPFDDAAQRAYRQPGMYIDVYRGGKVVVQAARVVDVGPDWIDIVDPWRRRG